MALLDSHPRVERYRFASFDAGKPAPEAEMPNPVPVQQAQPEPASSEPAAAPLPATFSEQELEQAKKLAHQAGFQAGMQDAEEKRNKAAEEHAAGMRSLLEVIANRITLASEDHANLLKNQQDLTLKLSLAIARKVAGEALKREPYASVEALLKECTGLISGQKRIVIIVSPQKSEGLRQSAESLQPYLHNYSGDVKIEQDDTLGENDCRIEWKNGEATRNAETLWSEIESLLKKTLLTS